MKWQGISVDIKTLSPVCPCPRVVYMYKIMEKIVYEGCSRNTRKNIAELLFLLQGLQVHNTK